MVNAGFDIQAATTIDLFSRMNREQVEYALLRNYELYPKFGHDIDLVVRWRDLSRFVAVAKSCALDHGWSVLTECDHWARSSCREHNIQTLQFYSPNPPLYLRIDAFHAFLLQGLPLFDEDALLRDRILDDRGFYRIDEGIENFFRILQIAKLTGKTWAQEKTERYRQRFLSFMESANDLSSMSAGIGFPKISTAIALLRSGHLQSFKKEVDRQKRAWWIRRILSQPFRTSKKILERFFDILRIYWFRPCGFNVRVFACDDERRERLLRIMQQLAGANLIFTYTTSTDFKKRLRVRERGGIVVEWTTKECADVIMDSQEDEQRVMASLITLMINRHPRILDRRIE